MKSPTLAIAYLCLAVPLAGCVTSAPHLHRVAHQLEREMPGVTFEPEMALKLGRISLGLARGIVRLAADDDEDAGDALAMMSGLERVEVGNFRTEGRPGAEMPKSFERSLARAGWKTMVRVRDEGEHVWIVYRTAEGSSGPAEEHLRSLLVVSLDGEELNMVRLEGRLDRTVSAAMRLARRHSRDEPSAELANDPDHETVDGQAGLPST